MKKIIRRPIAMLLVLCMLLPMFVNIAVAVGEGEDTPSNTTTINFASDDGNTYQSNSVPRLEAGKDFGAWTYLGGHNMSTTKLTSAFIQSNSFTQGRWLHKNCN